jgi:hypothetical protein
MVASLAPSAAFAAALAFGGAPALAANVTIEDPRPVAKAIEEIERLTGRPITYEDPPYLHPSTVVDVTEMIRRDPSPAAAGSRAIIPKGGVLTFALPANPVAADERGAVDAIVRSYNAGQSAVATFAVVHGDKLTHVVPQRAMGPSGRLDPLTPVLDTKITLPAKARTALALLEEICRAISAASRQPVEIGMAPMNGLDRQQIAFGADGEPARLVLEKLVVASAVPLSWRLLYDPGLKTYYMNLPVVRQPRR